MNLSIPDLPRQMLWTDKKSIDEFFILDPINEAFYEVFVTLREEPFAVKINEVKIFNEVYYQLTRMVYEQPLGSDLTKYVNDIKANLGWNYSAELVMSMVFHFYLLIENNKRLLNRYFMTAINLKFVDCLYWNPFYHCFEKLEKEKIHLKYKFQPQPMGWEWFKEKYINWNKITRNYDMLCIEKVINLWNDVENKREIANMIKDFLSKAIPSISRLEMREVFYLINDCIKTPDTPHILSRKEKSPWNESDQTKEHLDEFEKEKVALKQHISEIEADNKRLNALLEKKKHNGTARKFTLVEIVNYCKGCVDWDDVKSIVAMLNKLLRRIATKEDSDLVDSIEAEFFNRKYGDTIMGDKNIFKDNSGLNRITLPKGMTTQEAIKLLQNKVKENGEEG